MQLRCSRRPPSPQRPASRSRTWRLLSYVACSAFITLEDMQPLQQEPFSQTDFSLDFDALTEQMLSDLISNSDNASIDEAMAEATGQSRGSSRGNSVTVTKFI